MGYRPAGTGISHKLKAKRTARVGIAVLVTGMLGFIIEAQYEPVSVTVVRVIDGDTLRVRAHGKEYTVRLTGVDTPETKHSTKAAEHFRAEASAYTRAALEGQVVELETDRTGDTRDRYGRLLRYVRIGGADFKARLIREGYAHAARRFRYSRKEPYIRLEAEARKRGRGLWSHR